MGQMLLERNLEKDQTIAQQLDQIHGLEEHIAEHTSLLQSQASEIKDLRLVRIYGVLGLTPRQNVAELQQRLDAAITERDTQTAAAQAEAEKSAALEESVSQMKGKVCA